MFCVEPGRRRRFLVRAYTLSAPLVPTTTRHDRLRGRDGAKHRPIHACAGLIPTEPQLCSVSPTSPGALERHILSGHLTIRNSLGSGSRRQCHLSLFVPLQFRCQIPCQPDDKHPVSRHTTP